MPLGLLTLASIIRNKHDVVIYEPKHRIVKAEDYITVAEDILSYNPKILGFSTWCISYAALLLIAKAVKSLQPNMLIIFGGPQASITAYETLTHFPFVDYVLKGEADLSFPILLDEINKKNQDLSRVPGLVYWDIDKNIRGNNIASPIQNLDELPVPSYDLFPIQKTVKLDVGRGCPFKCTYCTTTDFFSKKYRTKSVGRVIKEMLTVRRELQITNIGFAHDMLTMNSNFVFELCDQLIDLKNEKGVEFTWTCSARIDCVSEEMLVKMKEAGCQSVFFGIESGSSKIQGMIKKNLDITKSFVLADSCRKIGLNMFASFIIGFPEETRSDVDKTLETLIKLALKGCYVQSSELSLLPGTPLFKTHKQNLKIDGNFSNFSNALCSKVELDLIYQYPEIFSSFYYLPVRPIKRQEMVFLNRLINKINMFRNSIFLLSKLIMKDIESVQLVPLIKEVYKQLKPKNKENIPTVIHWINILSNYIEYNQDKLPPYMEDVFNFESYVALIISVNSRWRLVHTPNNREVLKNDFLIQPTPIWRILKTKYILENIIPSINSWEENKKRFRKGKYFYLIVAVTPIKCKKIKIKSKEVFLLENLSELFFSNYVKKVKTVLSEKETFSWIKRMRKLGVLEILPIT